MDSIDIKVQRSVFPLGRFSITIGDTRFFLRPREVRKIKLPETGEYEIIVTLYWLKKKTTLNLKNGTVVNVNHGIPDSFYFVGLFISLLILILSFVEITSWFLLPIVSLIGFLPVLYITFMNGGNYFKIL